MQRRGSQAGERLLIRVNIHSAQRFVGASSRSRFQPPDVRKYRHHPRLADDGQVTGT